MPPTHLRDPVGDLLMVHYFLAAEVLLGLAEGPSPHLLEGRERTITALLPEALERGHRTRGAQSTTRASGKRALAPGVRLSLKRRA